MKFYLAQALIEPYLAALPEKVHYVRGLFVGHIGSHTLDTAQMKEAPHQVFVNWPSTDEAITEFTLKYGLLDPRGKHCMWRFGIEETSRDFKFRPNEWRQSQKYFQEYWDSNAKHSSWDATRHDLARELMISEIVNAPELCHPGLEVSDVRRFGKNLAVVLESTTLWQYLCALMVFQNEGELRTCANAECPAPRFIVKRKDQMFCSSDCASLVAKRRWWKLHGESWRRSRKSKRK